MPDRDDQDGAIDILIVEDSASMAGLLRNLLESEGYRVDHVECGVSALRRIATTPPPVMLLDLGLPDMSGEEILETVRHHAQEIEIVVVTGESSLGRAIEVMRAGARDFLVKPVNKELLLSAVRNALSNRELRTQITHLKSSVTEGGFHGFVGSSTIMQPVYKIIRNVAKSKATVFITGESGTGKEVAAEALHKESDRHSGPFVALNCGAIPKDLLESELFGHVKGAFTGATTHREGAAGKANKGTLFLDEICEMPLSMQVKLLRFVQTSSFQKLGSAETCRVDVRLVCATNRNPSDEVKEGRFREDLYYRLYVVPLELPPLRARGEDILEIGRSFLRSFAKEEGRSFQDFAPEAAQILMHQAWPGNVRQLQNVIRNVVVLHDDELVRPDMLPAPLLACSATGIVDRPGLSGSEANLVVTSAVPATIVEEDAVIRPLWLEEKMMIERAINLCQGNIQDAAKQLDISPSTIYRKKTGWLERGLEIDPRLLN